MLASVTFDDCVLCIVDPEDWGKEHVQQWLKWTQDEFSLPEPVNPHAIDLDGKQLVSLTKDDFINLTSESTGDIIHGHLTVLRKGKFPGVWGTSQVVNVDWLEREHDRADGSGLDEIR